jgi:regulator of protease activity HflC (stomatin/prohibitin superfamily)
MSTGLAILIGIIFILFISGVRILNEYERGVVFRLGRVGATKGPGFKWIIPMVDRMVRVSTRIVTTDVPPQDVITRDNVSISVNAVIYFRVMDPIKAIVEVEDFLYATSQFSQTTLRSVLGQSDLDELLSEREKINSELQSIIDAHTDPWGVKVTAVEVKHVDLPQEMQSAMARQAQAERERRAKIISAEGEYQAAEKLKAAADIIAKEPAALQLRYLQTLLDISADRATTTIIPFPIEMLRPFMSKSDLGK